MLDGRGGRQAQGLGGSWEGNAAGAEEAGSGVKTSQLVDVGGSMVLGDEAW